MHDLPFRTNRTWLADDQLILLDVLFDGAASFRLLRRENFHEQWNLGYSHGLDDGELRCHLRWLCEHGVLETERYGDQTVFRMTAGGGGCGRRSAVRSGIGTASSGTRRPHGVGR